MFIPIFVFTESNEGVKGQCVILNVCVFLKIYVLNKLYGGKTNARFFTLCPLGSMCLSFILSHFVPSAMRAHTLLILFSYLFSLYTESISFHCITLTSLFCSRVKMFQDFAPY